MKIGIMTFFYAHNYGAFLQAFALSEQLKKMGHDVYMINYINNRIYENYSLIKIDITNRTFLSSIKFLIVKILTLPIRYIRYYKFKNIIRAELQISKKYNSIKKLRKRPPQYDMYVTGSDQVWSIPIVGELSDAYTLNFGNADIKKISYAASIGDILAAEKNKKEFLKKLNSIDKISVREEDAKVFLERTTNKNIDVVLDPTLLIKKEEWDNKLIRLMGNENKYIFAYMVTEDEEYKKIVENLSNKTDLRVIYFNKQEKYKNKLKLASNSDPFEFINLIKNAEFVVTTSFHATVFSVIYSKKFWVVPHRKTGNRVKSLLERLQLQNRIVYSAEEFNEKDIEEKINYKQVNEKLEEEREKSLKFLNDALNREN